MGEWHTSDANAEQHKQMHVAMHCFFFSLQVSRSAHIARMWATLLLATSFLLVACSALVWNYGVQRLAVQINFLPNYSKPSTLIASSDLITQSPKELESFSSPLCLM